MGQAMARLGINYVDILGFSYHVPGRATQLLYDVLLYL
jgi:hypothetical protein